MLKRGWFIALLIISIIYATLMWNINTAYPIHYEKTAVLLPVLVIMWRAWSVDRMKERKSK